MLDDRLINWILFFHLLRKRNLSSVPLLLRSGTPEGGRYTTGGRLALVVAGRYCTD